MKFLQSRQVLVHYQHGFRAGHSCETQLITTIEELAKSIDDKAQTDVTILDFAKAFDTVPHRRLLTKLRGYGVDAKLVEWIEEWLTKRTQTVVLDGVQSAPARVRSGVPQGTVLGPLLFLIFVNDMGEEIDSKMKLVADDCLLYRTIRSEEDAEQLQSDLDKLHQWSARNYMRFNINKCQQMTVTLKRSKICRSYTMDGEELQRVKSAKYLGITLTEKLSWREHVREVAKRAMNTPKFARRSLRNCRKTTKEKTYKALVRPKLEYSASAWTRTGSVMWRLSRPCRDELHGLLPTAMRGMKV